MSEMKALLLWVFREILLTALPQVPHDEPPEYGRHAVRPAGRGRLGLRADGGIAAARAWDGVQRGLLRAHRQDGEVSVT